MTLLTWISIMLGAALRNREWTLDGMKVGLSNRDHLPEATPLGGRAERAAANTKENFILFAALALTAQLAGLASRRRRAPPCSSGREWSICRCICSASRICAAPSGAWASSGWA